MERYRKTFNGRTELGQNCESFSRVLAMDRLFSLVILSTFLADGISTHSVSRSTALISKARILLTQKLLAPTMENTNHRFFTMLLMISASEIN